MEKKPTRITMSCNHESASELTKSASKTAFDNSTADNNFGNELVNEAIGRWSWSQTF